MGISSLSVLTPRGDFGLVGFRVTLGGMSETVGSEGVGSSCRFLWDWRTSEKSSWSKFVFQTSTWRGDHPSVIKLSGNHKQPTMNVNFFSFTCNSKSSYTITIIFMHNINFSILNADTLSIYNYERRMASFSSVPLIPVLLVIYMIFF